MRNMRIKRHKPISPISKVQLSNSLMAQKSTAADIESEYQQGKMQADVDRQMSEQGEKPR